jgi:uncharacterized protein
MARLLSYLVNPDDQHPIAVDFHYPEKGVSPGPVLLFLHGFKGFKDWGYFPLAAEFLARSGFAIVRFNFSHNGTTPDQPTEFADLEAFGRNTFSRELEEVSAVIDDLQLRDGISPQCDPRRLGIIGHSRGGATALLAAHADPRIKAVATWAAVSDFEPRVNPPELEQWYRDGVLYTLNSRTQQQMPQYYSLREDFYRNKSRLDICAAVSNLQKPQLIIHGSADEAVKAAEAEALKRWNPAAELVMLEGADHTFGGKHPWEEKELPADAVKVLQATIGFFRETL